MWALCKFNQSTGSGHSDRERLNDRLIKAICLQHQSSPRADITHRHTGTLTIKVYMAAIKQ